MMQRFEGDDNTSRVRPDIPPDPPGASSTRRSRLPASWAVLALVLGAAVIGALVGVGAYRISGGTSGSGDRGILSSQETAPRPAMAAGSVAKAAALISPSVVTLDVTGSQSAGTGSGTIIRADGYVLTNNHVVTLDSSQPGISTRIVATLSDGRTATAELVGTDATDDLAVVRITGLGTLPAATFARSSTLVVGQSVVAVGAPLGLSQTVTSGIVSALARPVQAGSSGQAVFDAIQTDAAINPGNSGGPLVDLAGHVIGTNSAIASTGTQDQTGGQSGNIGIGFAIPSDESSRIARQLIATGHASHAIIGVTVSSSGSSPNGGPTSATGATVESVKPGSPAAQAGIQPGDRITMVGRQRTDDPISLMAAVRSYAPGQKVSIVLSRNSTSRTVTVTLAGSTSG